MVDRRFVAFLALSFAILMANAMLVQMLWPPPAVPPRAAGGPDDQGPDDAAAEDQQPVAKTARRTGRIAISRSPAGPVNRPNRSRRRSPPRPRRPPNSGLPSAHSTRTTVTVCSSCSPTAGRRLSGWRSPAFVTRASKIAAVSSGRWRSKTWRPGGGCRVRVVGRRHAGRGGRVAAGRRDHGHRHRRRRPAARRHGGGSARFPGRHPAEANRHRLFRTKRQTDARRVRATPAAAVRSDAAGTGKPTGLRGADRRWTQRATIAAPDGVSDRRPGPCGRPG